MDDATGAWQVRATDDSAASPATGASTVSRVAARAAGPVVLAAVDVGSNSVHLLVAAVRGHDVEPLVDESVFLGLAHGVDATGILGGDARASLADVLARYAVEARARGVAAIVFLGTEPIRRAADAARVVAEVEAASGVGLHVVSHDEEAYLTLLGVTGGRRLAGELAVVDIGGGSTEVVDARPGEPIAVEAIGIGSARLTAAILEHDPPTAREVDVMRAEATAHVAALPSSAASDIVAVGGTASNLAKLLAGVAGDRVLTRPRLASALEILLSSPSADVAERHLLSPARARLLPAGAAILGAILDRYGREGVRVAEEGMREGTVVAAARAGAAWRDRLPGLVRGWD